MTNGRMPFHPPCPDGPPDDSTATVDTGAATLRAFAFLLGTPLLLLALSLPLAWATDDWREHRAWQYAVGVATLWIMTALVVAQARRERLSGPRDWFGRLRASDVAVAAALLVAGTAAMYLFSEWTGSPRAWHLPRGVVEKALWILLCLSVGFCEEMIYRGYCLTRLIAATGSPAAAWLMQAALYGLLHFAFGPAWIGFTTGVGLFMGWLVLWRKSLWPAVLVHVLADAAVLLGGH